MTYPMQEGWTPLIGASYHGYVTSIILLLANQAKVNTQTEVKILYEVPPSVLMFVQHFLDNIIIHTYVGSRVSLGGGGGGGGSSHNWGAAALHRELSSTGLLT